MKEERQVNKFCGKKIRIVLPNNIYYHGTVISEDDIFLTIIDKFQQEVRLNKNHIVSMEVQN